MSENTQAGAIPADDLITPEAIEMMAEHLLEEDCTDSGWTWPTHEDDDGYRGDSYVRIAPPDTQARLREKAQRVLIRSAQISKRAAIGSPAVVPESVRRSRYGLIEAYDSLRAAIQENHEAHERAGARENGALEKALDILCRFYGYAGDYRRGFVWMVVRDLLTNSPTAITDAQPLGRAAEGGEAVANRLVAEALAEFQRRNGYHRPVIEGLLTEFGELLLTKIAPTPPASAGDVPGSDRERIARLVYEEWLCHGQKPNWVTWEEFPLISPEDYECCFAIADKLLATVPAVSKPEIKFGPLVIPTIEHTIELAEKHNKDTIVISGSVDDWKGIIAKLKE